MSVPPRIQKWIDSTKISIREIVWAIVILAAGMGWVDTRYVHAGEFKDYQQNVERRLLERDRRQLEQEVLRLEVKREVYPQEFNAVDKAMLRKNNEQLRFVNEELKQLQKAK